MKKKAAPAPYVDNNPKTVLGLQKPSVSKVPAAGILHCALAFMDGAAKYGAYNWRERKVSASIYVDAALRHLQGYFDGENFDPVSKVHHLGHAMACCAIVLDALEGGQLIDDRPLKGTAAQLVRRYVERRTLERRRRR